jgi:hypothetical protein
MPVSDFRPVPGTAVKRAKTENRSPGSDPVVLEQSKDLTDDRIHAYVLQVVADAPALTSEQQATLRSLFRASSSDWSGAAR